jgi:uncharacterized membrane protein
MSEPVESRRGAHALESLRAVILSPLFIAFLTAVCVVVRHLRTYADVGPHYAFVGFNLFLAWIPLVLAYGLSYSARSKAAWIALPPLAVLWIIFLPNAPYLVTDLVHLEEGVNAVNVVLLSLLAITGVLLGVKSLKLVQGAVERLFGRTAGWRFVQGIAVLTAVGIYLGRVLRWNSWTVIHHPEIIMHAVVRSPDDPRRLVLALCATVVFTIGFLVAYRVLAGPDVVRIARPARGGSTR